MVGEDSPRRTQIANTEPILNLNLARSDFDTYVGVQSTVPVEARRRYEIYLCHCHSSDTVGRIAWWYRMEVLASHLFY